MRKQDLVQEFIERVEWIFEVEYGDFKRKLGLYINRLEDDLGEKDPETQQLIDELKYKVVYDPNGDIDWTRVQVLEIAKKLLKNAA